MIVTSSECVVGGYTVTTRGVVVATIAVLVRVARHSSRVQIYVLGRVYVAVIPGQNVV